MKRDEVLARVGKICKAARRREGFSQLDAALDTGYCLTNVSSFERGVNNNATVFMWYLRVLTPEELEDIRGVTHEID